MNVVQMVHVAKSRGLALALIAILPASSMAADRAAGEQKAAVCASCHGRQGVSQVPSYPNLAGQKEQYLRMALKAYKTGQRKGGQATLMQGQAAALSEEDMANLAAYYANLPAAGERQADP